MTPYHGATISETPTSWSLGLTCHPVKCVRPLREGIRSADRNFGPLLGGVEMRRELNALVCVATAEVAANRTLPNPG